MVSLYHNTAAETTNGHHIPKICRQTLRVDRLESIPTIGQVRLTVFENPFSLKGDSDICSKNKDNSGNGQTDGYT